MLVNIEKAVSVLNSGEVLAYPTEAVYGLGCCPKNIEAVQKVIDLKKRDSSKGVILIASNFEQLIPYLGDIESSIVDKAMQTWPGPVTWILPAAEKNLVTGQRDKIAVRVTDHPVVRQLCDAFNGAIVSTSANHEGLPPALNHSEIENYFPGLPTLFGELGGLDKPTRIVDATSDEVLRD